MNKTVRDSSLADIGFKKFAPAIACFIVVFILVTLPGDSLPSTHEWMEVSFLDKWVHTTMFAVLTFLFLLPVAQSSMFRQQKRHYFIRIALAACIWGITTEYIQKFYIPTRDFDLLDWAADSAGVLIAFIYCRKFHGVKNH
jgi:VanZ family protein